MGDSGNHWLADVLRWSPATRAQAWQVTAAMLGLAVPVLVGVATDHVRLGMAAAIGVGNGAVFKLVPEHFPASVGSVTGLVGAAGGLGGFFPPLLLGVIKELTGAFTWGFVLLGIFALACMAVLLFDQARNLAASPA